jgi:hypothetical protein
LTVKRRETGKGLQSTFGCPKTLRGSTATDPSNRHHASILFSRCSKRLRSTASLALLRDVVNRR